MDKLEAEREGESDGGRRGMKGWVRVMRFVGLWDHSLRKRNLVGLDKIVSRFVMGES